MQPGRQDQYPAEGGRIHVAHCHPTDRALQDQIIEFLTDASARSEAKDLEFLDANEVARAERFSRFLARRYYRDRLHRGFRYSTALLGSEAAAKLVDTVNFNPILESCTLGSLATASMVGKLAVSELRARGSDEWWTELLDYEFAFFMQLATSERTPGGRFFRNAISTLIHEFQFAIPELLESLKKAKVSTNVVRKPTTLLFSRTHHGRIYVVELDATARAVVRAVNGSRHAAEIAECADLGQKETERILADLVRISAVLPPSNEAA